ncbi:pentatricopeptide repeat-containing protein At1g62930, chloroplastic-like [Hibiscus syriacus]|uniref:pentatricopeptide repeat-containing protein At1g62930, chloroplastic-like n=1 Tax=Hibiscus syriacus TaxID=106335 RepID=UPI0019218968|nr:pentatricopeptide repeat-containing protein At1g62930, chloroplastic-like [Hibiscus syriacus]
MIDEAITILELMSQRDVKPNVVSYSCLIHGCCSSGKWAEATSLLDRMMDEGVHPNVLTFSSLIEVLCKEKKTEEAISLFELVIQRGTNPNIFAYNCLIHGFCNSSKWTEAASLLNKMMNEEVHPDVVTFNSLINALCKEKRTEEAITMWWTNESETWYAIQVNGQKQQACFVRWLQRILNLDDQNVLCACEMNKAQDAFDSMATKDFEPDLGTYKMLINGYVKSKRKEEALSIAEETLEK